ncbi:MAG TPA: dTDP-4-amino-4,6-dideoxygalactose transaminase [Roseovarius sp.]|nr:dTDP-4-amino-4,6-dideoxygalactose transaminase [Roseovarius sp.]
MKVPFNRMHPVGRELDYVAEAASSSQLGGTGPFARKCEALLTEHLGGNVLLTSSATASLEMAALLLDLGPGDEVIMPSFTFVSTANAAVLRGARVRFCDIEPNSLNIDASRIEALINERTKCIVPIHYAGVGCEMDHIMSLCERYGLSCIEDAAQGIDSYVNGRPLGSFAPLAAISFHESKNLGCGEGGCLVINDPSFLDRARAIRDKGTNRHAFSVGLTDKYTWVDIGSSYTISELNAAFLFGQINAMSLITERRLSLWQRYARQLAPLREAGLLSWNDPAPEMRHNAHTFYLLLRDERQRAGFIASLHDAGVQAFFHYVPLHLSPMGRDMGYEAGDLPQTEDLASRLVRLPLFFAMRDEQVDYTVERIFDFFGSGAVT